MSHETEASVMLVQTRSAFEAETVAAALRDRGIDARVADAATAGVFGGAIGTAKVMVLASQENEARAALADIKAEGSTIDWSSVEPEGTPPVDAGPDRGSRSRQALWVVTVLMIPIGLAVLAYGTQYPNPMVKAIGGAVLLAAMAVGANLLLTGRSAGAE